MKQVNVMSRNIIMTMLASVIALSLLPFSPQSVFGQHSVDPSKVPQSSEWLRFCPQDEEFSVLVPVQPTLLDRSTAGGYTYERNGERVLQLRAYSGYFDEFVFVIESYTAMQPQKLFTEMYEPFKNLPLVEELQVNGVTQRKYVGLVRRSNTVQEVHAFTAARHIYVVTAIARDNTNPSIARFFSSFSLRDYNPSATEIAAKKEDSSLTPSGSQPEVFLPNEADEKVVVAWKGEPRYTEEARRKKRTGIVLLKAILTATGKVLVLEVVNGLKDGLTERSIEAAKSLRFLPAKKDGKTISLQMSLEYHFNLY